MANFDEQFEANADSAIKPGIIAAVLLIIVLGGFFWWYQSHFSDNRFNSMSGDERGGFFNSLVKQDSVSSADVDHDGLNEAEERAAQTNPAQIDSDNDGLTDGEEVKTYGTNPNLADSDGDGQGDGEEIKNRRNPLDPSPSALWPPLPTNLPS